MPASTGVVGATQSDSLWRDAARRFRRHRLAMFGSIVLAGMVLAVVAGPVVYRVPIDEIDFPAKLRGAAAVPPLGAGHLGQDIPAPVPLRGPVLPARRRPAHVPRITRR